MDVNSIWRRLARTHEIVIRAYPMNVVARAQHVIGLTTKEGVKGCRARGHQSNTGLFVCAVLLLCPNRVRSRIFTSVCSYVHDVFSRLRPKPYSLCMLSLLRYI